MPLLFGPWGNSDKVGSSNVASVPGRPDGLFLLGLLDDLVEDAMWQPKYSHVELGPSMTAHSSGGATAPREAGGPDKQRLAASFGEGTSFSLFVDVERVNSNRLLSF
ncbi:hypothetical protein Pmar_PMAR010936 [Perkinsus marinus ATCC 50983]|uniref:Uncharacterized protein n=1 Tax=Perkinsus marinus (strain ATCC 50983 / TXsc) TaxID=423536 RepID=C5LUD9_PERM5|nr:hypothetical protein Pmar_PMAR010936 [Perkinsus marinus ATCC 50983]EEQ99672.1 hypothetical protein Pmar_PMAR010936 [Perkinsus marinus ATCC 50983]|eukprot:XP_002766955.1 hypothetical protein Pmar_PMAR010936 [Perkinsus marinus ATCC 50983]